MARSRSTIKEATLRHGGAFLFWTVCLFSIRRVLIEPNPGHYRVFMGAARALWQGKDAYATDFGSGVGFYFYSPFSALFVFGPLSLLPERLGVLVFLLVSCAVLFYGGRYFGRALAGALGKADISPAMSLFWAITSAPLLTAIVTTKLEIAMTGLLLAAAGGLITSPSRIWPGFVIALLTTWKFQPLPTLLLWGLALVRLREPKGLIVGLSLGAFLGFVLPFFCLPWPFLMNQHAHWLESLRDFSNRAYLDFENVFAFLRHAFGWAPGMHAARAICLGAALGAAAIVWGWIGGAKRDRLGRAELIARSVLLATGLGAAYSVAFSPLGQNNALVLCAPLILWACLTSELGLRSSLHRGLLMVVLAASVALPYSDLVPLSLRDHFHAISLKQMLLLGVAIALAGIWIFRDRSWVGRKGSTVSSARFVL